VGGDFGAEIETAPSFAWTASHAIIDTTDAQSSGYEATVPPPMVSGFC
jgi:hypothetical protein